MYSYKLYKLASAENDPLSLLRIGDYHYYGIAIEVNYEKAISYYKKILKLEDSEAEY